MRAGRMRRSSTCRRSTCSISSTGFTKPIISTSGRASRSPASGSAIARGSPRTTTFPTMSRSASSDAGGSPCFRPTSSRNLYLGPIDHTPAGRPVSMVDLREPGLRSLPALRRSAGPCPGRGARAGRCDLHPVALVAPGRSARPVQHPRQLLVARRAALPRQPAGRTPSRHAFDPRSRPRRQAPAGRRCSTIMCSRMDDESRPATSPRARAACSTRSTRNRRASFAPTSCMG